MSKLERTSYRSLQATRLKRLVKVARQILTCPALSVLMKFIQILVGHSGDQRPIYEFHLGREEAELLVGLLENYQRNGPKGFQWEPDLNRSRNMLKSFDEVLPRKQKRNV